MSGDGNEAGGGTKWLRGSQTFKYMKVSSGRSRGRAFDLKNRASDRIVLLFRQGVHGDKLACPMRRVDDQRMKELHDQASFARLPVPTKIEVLRRRRRELEDELRRMEQSASQIARTFHLPDILYRIDEISSEIRRLENGAGEEEEY